MLKKLTLLCVTTAFLASCSTAEYSTKVKSMQRKDKTLSCSEVLLEMNEADFYRKTALKNRGPKLKNILMPLGYISTYMNSEEAVNAADARVAYLDQIYEILRCSEKESISASAPIDARISSSVGGEYVQPAYYYDPRDQAGYISPYNR